MVTHAGKYKMFAKDSSWNRDVTGAHALCKFTVANGVLTASINAHNLIAGDWYLVEIVDKSAGWNPISPDNYASFYGQADADGNLKITVAQTVTSGMTIEINMKNADNVALLEPSTYGVPSEWIIGTGQGWDYVLYGSTLISIA